MDNKVMFYALLFVLGMFFALLSDANQASKRLRMLESTYVNDCMEDGTTELECTYQMPHVIKEVHHER